MQLKIATLPDSSPAVQIQEIGKKDDGSSPFKPSSTTTALWLRPGEYIATLQCRRQTGDEGMLDAIKNGDLLPEDRTYTFKIESEKVSYYLLDCGTDHAGQTFIRYSEVLMFTEY
ncbi:MAG TPA: hypothetical protein VF651_05900 [Gammaproteobacteria bacterium]